MTTTQPAALPALLRSPAPVCSPAYPSVACPALHSIHCAAGTFKDFAKGKGRTYHCPRCMEVRGVNGLALGMSEAAAGCCCCRHPPCRGMAPHRMPAQDLSPSPTSSPAANSLQLRQQRSVQEQTAVQASLLAQVLAATNPAEDGGLAPMQE